MKRDDFYSSRSSHAVPSFSPDAIHKTFCRFWVEKYSNFNDIVICNFCANEMVQKKSKAPKKQDERMSRAVLKKVLLCFVSKYHEKRHIKTHIPLLPHPTSCHLLVSWAGLIRRKPWSMNHHCWRATL